MDKIKLKALLLKVKKGVLSPDEALHRLKDFPYEDMGHTKVDNHRSLRKGFPEVIYCEGKTKEQTSSIFKKLLVNHGSIMGTRASKEVFNFVKKAIKNAKYNENARIITVGKPIKPEYKPKGTILIISAGTSDMKVAEEAAVTAEFLGHPVERLFDVGVAGIHRLLSHSDKLDKASIMIVVAGMEGALPSVVGGLSKVPVIAVPTSVGYGASFNGLAALLAMLNTCAPGVATMNIDNGFGAAVFATMANR